MNMIITTRKGENIIVPTQFARELEAATWHLNAKGYPVWFKTVLSRAEARAEGRPRQEAVFLARRVMELHLGRPLSRDEHIDHRDRNPLNNALDNLRVVPKYGGYNQINVGIRVDNTTGYKGVDARDGRHEAKISYRGKRLWLGAFDDAEQAARAYNAKARELFGEYAYQNQVGS